jgi:endonuclease/exonuclease/phosphatase family metal-dependent hydrolase
MNNSIRLLAAFLTIWSFTPLAAKAQTSSLTIAFYNQENLFDTIDDPATEDSEFLPESKSQWTDERYKLKLNNMSKVIRALNADVVGLCEVENRKTTDDLAWYCGTGAKSDAYGVVHFDSPDPRGIDVALIYKKKSMTVLCAYPIRFLLPHTESNRTRDILYVKGELPNKSIMHIFVNHFPSRREGTAESSYKRQYVAEQVRQRVDSLLKKDKRANILIMGDFNDEPGDSSMSVVLKAACTEKEAQKTGLYNTMCPLKGMGLGSHQYRKEWSMLDQLIVSQSLLSESNKVGYEPASATIFKEEWLLEQNEKYKGQPYRTYVGSKYLGGYSDHLPVYLRLKLQ